MTRMLNNPHIRPLEPAGKLDLVLAGDIFDLHRTALWFKGDGPSVRPYVSADASEIDASLEQKVIEILNHKSCMEKEFYRSCKFLA